MIKAEDQGGGLSGGWGGGSSGDGNDYGGNNGRQAQSPAQIIMDHIDTTKLDDCPKAIFELLKKDGTAGLEKILNQFEADKEYNVEMTMGTTKPNNYAETTRRGKNDYVITISQNYENATTLYKATAIVHELVHAYLLSYVDDYATYPTNAPFADYPALFEFYVTQKALPKEGSVPAQHEAMASGYVNIIVNALYGYQSELPYGFDVTNQVYKDLAWGGLMETPTFKAKFPEGSADYNRINNRISAEQSGRPVGAGTPDEQSPRGKPCN